MDGLVKAKADKNVAMVIGLSKYTEEAACYVPDAGLGYCFFELWGRDKRSHLDYQGKHKMNVLQERLFALMLKDSSNGEAGKVERKIRRKLG